MDRKLKLKIMRILIVISVGVLMYKAWNMQTTKELAPRDYMPTKPMVKIFEGGFEGAGSIEIIDKIKGGTYQKKTLDSATMGVTVYKVTRDKYKLIYRDPELGKLEDNYLRKEPNIDIVILRNPIKAGVSWPNEDGSVYKIISIDEEIEIDGKIVPGIKLRYRKNNYEYYIYMAKGYGIVATEAEMGTSYVKEVDYEIDKYLNKLKK
jgi:hypothetical protein